MKVEFTFDPQRIARQGYTVDAVHQTLKKNFAVKGLRCVSEQDTLVFSDNGNENDFANMWAIIMALLQTEWFTNFASSCIWYDDDGTEEDVLSQAWKVQGRKICRNDNFERARCHT
jgi:hypothetical protein